jgi:nucleoside-diphosphate-sugar epimerase
MTQDPVLITGAAGFIGFALAHRLLQRGRAMVGLDSVNDYYNPVLKNARLSVLSKFNNFSFHKIDLADRRRVETVFRECDFISAEPQRSRAQSGGTCRVIELTVAWLRKFSRAGDRLRSK